MVDRIKCEHCGKWFTKPDPWDAFCTICGSWIKDLTPPKQQTEGKENG